LNLNFIKV